VGRQTFGVGEVHLADIFAGTGAGLHGDGRMGCFLGSESGAKKFAVEMDEVGKSRSCSDMRLRADFRRDWRW